MRPLTNLILASAVWTSQVLSRPDEKYIVKPFTIDLGWKVPRMLDLIQNSHLPKTVVSYPGEEAGISVDTLEGLRQEWLHNFDWNTEQASMNQFSHFTTTVENLTVHFIHQKSKAPNAIPLILLHGWPGSFLEFAPIIENLTQPATTENGTAVAFDVIVPSLPGYAFSSPTSFSWTTLDTARIFNTLMTTVLGYDRYAVHGTDWGSSVAYHLYDSFNTTARAAHFAFLPYRPLTLEELATRNITLADPLEQFQEQRYLEWSATGSGYFQEQATKPNTIGLALQDHPVGQLAWIGEKFIDWSDPKAGTGPSVLTHNEILRGISLYYLTGTFTSSVYIYAQNAGVFQPTYTKARTDAPMLFSGFKYNVGFWPPALAAEVGNLVLYRNHDFGGHFPGLDNPAALLEDLRELATYWA